MSDLKILISMDAGEMKRSNSAKRSNAAAWFIGDIVHHRKTYHL